VTLIQTTVLPGLFTRLVSRPRAPRSLGHRRPVEPRETFALVGRPDAMGIVVPAALAANKITPPAVIAE